MNLPKNSKNSQSTILEEECRNFFSTRKKYKKNEFWAYVDKHLPECRCERVSVNAISPHPIATHEKLVSVVTHSKYFDANTGKVLPNIAMRLNSGLSADRVQYTDLVNFEKRARDLVEDDPTNTMEYCGVFVFSVKKLRNIFDDGNRCFAVYDTATLENPSHSEVVQTNHPENANLTRKIRSWYRSKIREKLPNALEYSGMVVSSQKVFSS